MAVGGIILGWLGTIATVVVVLIGHAQHNANLAARARRTAEQVFAKVTTDINAFYSARGSYPGSPEELAATAYGRDITSDDLNFISGGSYDLLTGQLTDDCHASQP